MIRHRGRQQYLVGVTIRPGAFVPATTDDPFALRHGSGALDDTCDRFFFSPDVDQVDAFQAGTEAEHVRMRIDQPGNDRGTGKVDHAGVFTATFQRLAGRADVGNLVAIDDHRVGIRMPAGAVMGCARLQ